MKKAVILFNLGGPDKLENVEPFLFNLFNDPAILNLPSFFRYPLAKLISNRRAPTAKKIYQELGGSSPILKLTNEQSEAIKVQLNQNKSKNVVIGFGITEKTINSLNKADGLVVGSRICSEISKSLKNPESRLEKGFQRIIFFHSIR